jgi:hypothetical protein
LGAEKFELSMGSPSTFSARRDIYNCGMPDIGCANALFEYQGMDRQGSETAAHAPPAGPPAGEFRRRPELAEIRVIEVKTQPYAYGLHAINGA